MPPKYTVATVVCIICRGAYHKSNFERLDNTKYVGDNIVLCPKHVHVANITSNEEEEHLSETARIIIIHIKMRQTEEIRREILEELAGKTLEVQSAAQNNISKNEVIIAEHTLLNQLHKELQDKNKLLHELLEKYKDKVTDNQFTKKSFAEVTKKKKIQIQPKKDTKNYS